MEPSVKKLFVVGALGLIVTWGAYIYLELKPETTDTDQLVQASDEQKNTKKTKSEISVSNQKARTPKRTRPKTSIPLKPVPIPPKPVAAPAPPPVPLPIQPSVPPVPAPDPLADRFGRFETLFESETRDAVWADEKEKRIVELFKKGNYEDTLVDVSCRKTVCKMELKLDRPEVLFGLLKLPEFNDEIGQDAATRPVGAASDKKAISYFARKR
jgi:hypothetical protein